MLFSYLIDKLKAGDSAPTKYKVANDPSIFKGASLEKANTGEITFIEENSYLINSLEKTKASAIIIPSDKKIIEIVDKINLSWISVEEPRLAFAETLELFSAKPKIDSNIHKSAVLGVGVKIEKNVSIGANCVIGDNCKIASGTVINPGVVIYENVKIGNNNELHANCVLHRGTIIGDHCIIHSNCVIGDEGFGFIPTKNGWRKMPQTGIVIIENNVEIGCNSSIDRPAIGETRIRSGTKIDNLVQIGHGVTVGKNCAMAAQVGIAGGAEIGNNVILAGQVGVGNRVTVGDGVIASSKCGIHTNIEPGKVISGFPAMPNKLWLRCSASFKKLPETTKSIKRILDSSSD